MLDIRGSGFPDQLRRELETAWRTAVFDTAVDEKRVSLVVGPGPPATVRVIRFTGNQQLSGEQLDLVITPDRDADAWAGGDALIEAVVATYQTRGFLEATAKLARAGLRRRDGGTGRRDQ